MANLDQEHAKWMQVSLQQAKAAMDNKEVPVGCIMVYDGRVIATGSNQTNETKNATRHAELVAIDQVLEWCQKEGLNSADVFSKTTLYVTVEPCIMCAATLRIIHLPLVVYGCANDRFGGCGSVLDVHMNQALTEGPSFQCIASVYEEDAITMLKDFYKGENEHAPLEKRKLKESSDSKTTDN